jgi:ribosome-binding factor A
VSRLDRVKSVLMQEIAKVIQTKVNDRNVGFITITDVKMSRDLRTARVYFSHFGKDQDHEKTTAGLKKASKFIQMEVGKTVKMKFMPHLLFEYDPSLERGVQLLNTIKAISADDGDNEV